MPAGVPMAVSERRGRSQGRPRPGASAGETRRAGPRRREGPRRPRGRRRRGPRALGVGLGTGYSVRCDAVRGIGHEHAVVCANDVVSESHFGELAGGIGASREPSWACLTGPLISGGRRAVPNFDLRSEVRHRVGSVETRRGRKLSDAEPTLLEEATEDEDRVVAVRHAFAGYDLGISACTSLGEAGIRHTLASRRCTESRPRGERCVDRALECKYLRRKPLRDRQGLRERDERNRHERGEGRRAVQSALSVASF